MAMWQTLAQWRQSHGRVAVIAAVFPNVLKSNRRQGHSIHCLCGAARKQRWLPEAVLWERRDCHSRARQVGPCLSSVRESLVLWGSNVNWQAYNATGNPIDEIRWKRVYRSPWEGSHVTARSKLCHELISACVQHATGCQEISLRWCFHQFCFFPKVQDPHHTWSRLLCHADHQKLDYNLLL